MDGWVVPLHRGGGPADPSLPFQHTRSDRGQVLIVGLKGVGIETAKNLILAGPGAVTLWDDHATEVRMCA